MTGPGDDRVFTLQRARAEPSLHARSHGSVLAGYTYSKSVDVASNLGEQVNPFDLSASEAPSAFDLRHNFVVSYSYDLPFARLFGPAMR